MRAADDPLPADSSTFRATVEPQEATTDEEGVAAGGDFGDGDASEDEEPDEEPDEAMQNLLNGLASIDVRDDGIPAHMMGEWDLSQT